MRRPERDEPELDVLQERGLEHERRHVERLLAEGPSIREIGEAGPGLGGLRAQHEATLAAMREVIDVIYQATFFDGRWLGHADFLERVERPSALGPYGYEVTDTNLARGVKTGAVLQISACQASRRSPPREEQPPLLLQGHPVPPAPHSVLLARLGVIREDKGPAIDHDDQHPGPPRRLVHSFGNRLL